MKDILPSYLDVLYIQVRRYIPTFEEVCDTELTFETPTYTRNFVVFNNERKFKIIDGFKYLESLKKENLKDGFLPIIKEQYEGLLVQEHELSPIQKTIGHYSSVYNKEGSIEEGMNDPVLRELIKNDNLRDHVLRERRGSLEKYLKTGKIPLVWIAKQNKDIDFYMAPLFVGTQSYYLAVGEARFLPQHHYDEEKYPFLKNE